MRILRFVLLVASVVGTVYIFHALHIGSIPSTAWLFGLGLVLNIIFLLFCGPIATGNSRLTYVLRLWYNAKMRELRERAGEPPRLD
jgi:uncharacterized membrane protein